MSPTGSTPARKSNDPKYTTVIVRRGDITGIGPGYRNHQALTTVPVGSYVSGTVQYIFADFNTRVKSGQVLAQLDPAIYEAQVTQARGNLQNAQDNLVTLAANVQVDQANLAKSQANVTYEQATAKRSAGSFQSRRRFDGFERSDTIHAGPGASGRAIRAGRGYAGESALSSKRVRR